MPRQDRHQVLAIIRPRAGGTRAKACRQSAQRYGYLPLRAAFTSGQHCVEQVGNRGARLNIWNLNGGRHPQFTGGGDPQVIGRLRELGAGVAAGFVDEREHLTRVQRSAAADHLANVEAGVISRSHTSPVSKFVPWLPAGRGGEKEKEPGPVNPGPRLASYSVTDVGAAVAGVVLFEFTGVVGVAILRADQNAAFADAALVLTCAVLRDAGAN